MSGLFLFGFGFFIGRRMVNGNTAAEEAKIPFTLRCAVFFDFQLDPATVYICFIGTRQHTNTFIDII